MYLSSFLKMNYYCKKYFNQVLITFFLLTLFKENKTFGKTWKKILNVWSLIRPYGIDFYFEIDRLVDTLIRVTRVVIIVQG